MKRRTAREKAVQALYQIDLAKADWHDALHSVTPKNQSDEFLHTCVQGVVTHQEEIDQVLAASLQNWRLERLAHTDRAILRLAAYEILFQTETPLSVVINEAVELGKTFGSDDSGKFIHGVLSSVSKREDLR